MSEPFIGEIKMFGFNFAPKGHALCDGKLMSIAQNSALFSLLGVMYGGDGRVTFGLPNLQGRTPIHVGPGYTQGQAAGEETHTLSSSELPSHTHLAVASSGAANATPPGGATWAAVAGNYAASPNGAMSATAIANTGGGQPHNNMQPYTVINFVIATVGVFPSRN